MMNKLAVITGPASGLGREFSLLLAADGYDLFLVDSNREGLERVSAELNEFPGISVEICVADLGEPDAAESVWSGMNGKEVDVWINNAGFGLYGRFAETSWELEEKMLQLHVITTSRLTKLVLKGMISRGHGRIMNVSSLAAFQPGPLMSVYYASKAYILSFSEALAEEIRGTGVTVTVLAPGWFRTNFQKSVAQNSGVKESNARLHTATTRKVAVKAYRAMMQGRTLVIPGLKNRLISLVPRLLPRKVTTRILRRIQERIR